MNKQIVRLLLKYTEILSHEGILIQIIPNGYIEDIADEIEALVNKNSVIHDVSNPFNAKDFEYSEFIKGKGKEYHYVSNKIHYFVNGELVKILNQ